MTTAIIYRRVSSARQSEEGKSLRDQDKELRDYCRAFGWRIIGNFEDAISGRREKTESRAGLAQALALACERKSTLVVYDLDRLARSQSVGMKIVEQLHDCGAGLVIKSLGVDTTTPGGKMIAGIMAAVAEWGSANIGAGVKRANRNTIREKGYRTQGRQPFGWKFDHKTGGRIPCPKEQRVLAQVARTFEENKSYNKTARLLREQGVLTPMAMRRGGDDTDWHPETVRRILSRD